MKKHDDDIIITFFQVFIIFGVEGSIKSMECGYSLDVELNSTSNKLPTLHTFDGPRYPKNKKCLKKCDDDVIIMFFQAFLGYSLDAELNFASNELSRLKFE